ncbi:MAG: hypothetical protein ACREMQ_11060 [Longimicrobiales bacterium]
MRRQLQSERAQRFCDVAPFFRKPLPNDASGTTQILFSSAGARWNLVALVFPPFAFCWGWRHRRAEQLTPVMASWTLIAGALSLLYYYAA